MSLLSQFGYRSCRMATGCKDQKYDQYPDGIRRRHKLKAGTSRVLDPSAFLGRYPVGSPSTNKTYRLTASASKYSLLIRVWFAPLVARLLSI